MSSQIDYKKNQARKKVIMGGAVILGLITLLSAVSSFMIYREGFGDLPFVLQQALSLFAVIVVEGAFVWLVYGFTRAFTSAIERLVCLIGMSFLVITMFINLVTHFMMVKKIPLQPFQEAWVSWGAVSIFIGVLLIVLFITLADPVTRIIRLELRYLGLQDEKIIEAKTGALDSERLNQAMSQRADAEADKLATRILGDSSLNAQNQPKGPRPGFVTQNSADPAIGTPEHRRIVGLPRDQYDQIYGFADPKK